jgi:hypothetical protein
MSLHQSDWPLGAILADVATAGVGDEMKGHLSLTACVA